MAETEMVEQTQEQEQLEAAQEKRVVEETADYWVIPNSVLTRAGVRNRWLRTWEEWSKTGQLWGGVPIIYPHVKGDVLEPTDLPNVGGFVRNVRLDDPKQRILADYWLAKHATPDFKVSDQAVAYNKETVTRFLRGDKLDSSPGYLSKRTPKQGTWEGQAYDFVRTDIVPDHLAILGVGGNTEKGACPWVAGCGPGRAQELRAAAESCDKQTRLKSLGESTGSQGHSMAGTCAATEHADLETRLQRLTTVEAEHGKHTRAIEALGKELGLENANCDQVHSRVKESLGRLKTLETEEKTRLEGLAAECAELEVPGDAKEAAVTDKRKQLALTLSTWPRTALEHHKKTLDASHKAIEAASSTKTRRDPTRVGAVEAEEDTSKLGVASLEKVYPKPKGGSQ